MYRFHQLLMNIELEPVIPIIAVLFGLVIVLCIGIFAIVIKFHTLIGAVMTLGFCILGLMLLLGLFCVVILLSRIYELTKIIFKRKTLTKLEKKFARSCQPITMNIWHFLRIESRILYLQIISLIICETSTLLVLYEQIFS